MKTVKINTLCAVALLLVLAAASRAQNINHSAHDSLLIGDSGDNTVKRFDAKTGEYLGVFITAAPVVGDCADLLPPANCLQGPRGLIFDGTGELLLANQNDCTTCPNGTILRYAGHTGAYLDPLVPYSDPHSPVAPRGIVLGEYLFVASDEAEDANDDGALRAYTRYGTFVAELPAPAGSLQGHFHPRGVVIGPDHLLYVSNPLNNPQPGPTGAPSLGGQILRYNPRDLSTPPEVFVTQQEPREDFNRPEGLAFGPDGNLYVTSFAPDAYAATGTHTDRVQIFAGPLSGNPGKLIDHIDLDCPSNSVEDRASAQALLFGPEGLLYVPIEAGNTVAGNSAGEVRRYNVHSKRYTVFYPCVENKGLLKSGWYLTFGETDPATLDYGLPVF